MKHLRLLLLAGAAGLLSLTACAQALPTTAGSAVSANADGTLRTPAAFFAANDDAIAAAVSPLVSVAWSQVTSKPTTLTGYGITDAQPLDSDLTAYAGAP